MANHLNALTGLNDALLHNGPCKLKGFSARESGTVATAAAFVLRDGIDATGKAIAFVELQGDRSELVTFVEPIECKVGLFLDRVSGETEVVAYV